MDIEDEQEELKIPSIQIVEVTIKLTKEQGDEVRELIRENFPHTFPIYCKKVGIKTPNFYNVLNGDRSCTLEWFNKLLSGLQYEVTPFNSVLQVREMQSGEIVVDVDSIEHENELASTEKEELELEESD